MRRLPIRVCLGLLISPLATIAADIDEFRVKRQEVFEFAERPRIATDPTSQPDRYIITFASKAYCDVTVAIEQPGDAGGPTRIVRHLAGGVLGPNAPEPFEKNSLKQKLVWDGKDDAGKYLDNRAELSVRVSLGLKPCLERTLFWSPWKRTSQPIPIIRAAPEGIYVFQGGQPDHLRLFDHDGNYLRTIYPFPADKVGRIDDLHWQTFPQDGVRLPLREGEFQATLLSCGDNAGFDGFGIGPKHQAGEGASAMAVHTLDSGRMDRCQGIALARLRLNRLCTDGSTGGLPLNGPKTNITYASKALPWHGGGRPVEASPTCAAFSPDGKRLYLTGHNWLENHGTGGMCTRWLHAVQVVDFEAGQPSTTVDPAAVKGQQARLFAGSDKEGDAGKGDDKLNIPTAVACDALGRVYVADYRNNRVQVFEPDGKLVKSIPADRPANVAIHPKTGEIYVFSWPIISQDERRPAPCPMQATRISTMPEAKPLSTHPIVLPTVANGQLNWDTHHGTQIRAELDGFVEPAAVWVSCGGPRWGGPWENSGPFRLTLKDGKYVVDRDFAGDVARRIVRNGPTKYMRQRLAVSPATGLLHVLEGDAGVGKSVGQLLQIDPQTAKVRTVELPFDVEDVTFDPQGHIYLRALHEIGRFDPKSWREVPFDYGQEVKNAGFASSKAEGHGKRNSPLAGGLAIPVNRYNHMGGMHVSVTGRLAVATHGNQSAGISRLEEDKALEGGRPFTVRLYPGRCTFGLVQVFDVHGRPVCADAIPGLAFTHGVGLDRRDNLYVMAMGARVLDGQRYFNEATDTLMRFGMNKGRLLAGSNTPVPLEDANRPKRPPDISAPGGARLGPAWVEQADWKYGGVGLHARHGKSEGFGCDCANSRFTLDYFDRSFAPEVDHYSVAVLDANGNLIVRVGRYGNVDDGRPLIPADGSPKTQAIGGDEVGLFYAPYVAVHTDRRLFIADPGNACIRSVRLDYHVESSVPVNQAASSAGK